MSYRFESKTLPPEATPLTRREKVKPDDIMRLHATRFVDVGTSKYLVGRTTDWRSNPPTYYRVRTASQPTGPEHFSLAQMARLLARAALLAKQRRLRLTLDTRDIGDLFRLYGVNASPAKLVTLLQDRKRAAITP